MPYARSATALDDEGATTVLLVEDDVSLDGSLSYYLRENGFRVAAASDGIDALRAARRGRPDVAVIDLAATAVGALEACRRIRDEHDLPILILTASTGEADLVAGLELGADDYMTKPFSARELVARLRALVRRARLKAPVDDAPRLSVGDLELDRRGRTVTRSGQSIALKPKEFDLLFELASEPGRVFTRAQLLERIWGYEFFAGGSRTIDVHIRWLREKLGSRSGGKARIITIRGVGYKFVP